jgi:hypothetical protein
MIRFASVRFSVRSRVNWKRWCCYITDRSCLTRGGCQWSRNLIRSWLIDDSGRVIVGHRASACVKISWFVRLASKHDRVSMKLEILGVVFCGLSIFFKPPSSRDLESCSSDAQ